MSQLRVKTGTVAVLLVTLWAARLETAVVKMDVDLREAGRRIYHARLVLPAEPGEIKLVYPKWIPGEHGPSGPVTDLAGIEFSAGDKKLDWWRDPADMFTFGAEVPAGAGEITVGLDFICAPPNSGSFTAAASATTRMAVVNWNQLLLYPAGVENDQIDYQVTLHLPAGWRYATALPVESEGAGQVTFTAVSLEKLIDSPLAAGRYYRRVDLTPTGGAPTHIEIFCDQQAGLAISDEHAAAYRKMVAEARALFGARHYDSYHFLLSLSDYIAHFGLEHHESSDDRDGEDMLIDDDSFRLDCSLLVHEMIHSWNGKYRRPQGMATRDYQTEKITDMLWVYEGLTHYLTAVLSTRSGLWTEDWARQVLARYADWLENRKGRSWRPLEDTAISAQLLFLARSDWAAWRRGVDFYREGVMIWLEVDALIRRESGGKKSIDDFCRLFFGGGDSGPQVKPYSFDDLVAALEQVQPYDWRTLLQERVRARETHPPLEGLALCGWRVDYTAKRDDYLRAYEGKSGGADLTASLGIDVDNKGVIKDVIPGTAADNAGLAPGMEIRAVNEKEFSAGQIRLAVEQTGKTGEPVELIVENSGFFRTYTLSYVGGARYPELRRVAGTRDLLSRIMAPLTGGAQKR